MALSISIGVVTPSAGGAAARKKSRAAFGAVAVEEAELLRWWNAELFAARRCAETAEEVEERLCVQLGDAEVEAVEIARASALIAADDASYGCCAGAGAWVGRSAQVPASEVRELLSRVNSDTSGGASSTRDFIRNRLACCFGAGAPPPLPSAGAAALGFLSFSSRMRNLVAGRSIDAGGGGARAATSAATSAAAPSFSFPCRWCHSPGARWRWRTLAAARVLLVLVPWVSFTRGSVASLSSNAKLQSCDVYIGYHGNGGLARLCEWLKSEGPQMRRR